jgi:hypothetical protein
MKIEWFFNDSFFTYGEDEDLALARLLVRDDGTAQVRTDAEVLEFDDEEQADEWLTSEEYGLLESLAERIAEEGFPPDPRIQAPAATSEEELTRQLVIKLDPPAYGPRAQPVPPTAGLPADAHRSGV